MVIDRGLANCAHVTAALLCVGVLFVFTAPSGGDLLRDPDAGSQLTKGMAIVHGLHPYTDIDSSVYGPAIFYLSALAQRLGGDSVLAEITLIAVGYFTAYLLLFWAFFQRSHNWTLYALFVLSCMLTLPRFHKYHVVLSPAIFLACLQAASQRDRAGAAGVWLGVGCAFAGLIRIDFGGYGVVASIVYIALRFKEDSPGQRSRAYAALFGTGLLITAPWLAFLMQSLSPTVLIAQFLDTTLGVYEGLAAGLPPYASALPPWSSPNDFVLTYWTAKVIPVAVAVWAAGLYLHASARRVRSQYAHLLAAAIAAGLFFLQASHRIDLSHVRQVFAPIAFIALLAAGARVDLVSRAAKAVSITARAALGLLICLATIELMYIHQLFPADNAVARFAKAASSWQMSKLDLVDQLSQLDDAGLRPLAQSIGRVHALTQMGEPVLFLPYAAQAYYFSDRMFATPVGWLNPGRFRRLGAEQRFIERMATTNIVADDPGFSFDGLAARNMRGYAPRLSRHVYEAYGIFEVLPPIVLLSNRAEVIEDHARFTLRLIDASALRSAIPDATATIQPTISTVNTLPVEDTPAQIMWHGAGLMMALNPPANGQACAIVVLLGESGAYAVADADAHPRLWSEIGAYDLIATAAAAAGEYELLRVEAANCRTNLDGWRTTKVDSTGARITFVSHPRGRARKVAPTS